MNALVKAPAVVIDVAEVANRIERDGPAYARVSALDLKALAGFVRVTLDDQATEQPTTTALLAAAVADAVKQHDNAEQAFELLAQLEADYDDTGPAASRLMDAREKYADLADVLRQSLNTLKTTFEKEFPNVGSN